MSGLSFGAKDLQDLKGVSRGPLVALAQRQLRPDAPRAKKSASTGAPATTPSGQQATAAATLFGALKRFSPSDHIAWMLEYLRFRFGPKHSFLTYEGQEPADGIYALAAEEAVIRVGLAGDWGTGTDEAHRVGQLIAEFQPHYTIHLGDVYYVGDPAEVDENFLGVARPKSQFTPCRWPLGSKASFALNGNHEMFARGFAYFDQVLPAMGEIKSGVAQGQKASFFCLMSDAWCILGLDTAYNSLGPPLIEHLWPPDAALHDEITKWLRLVAGKIGNRAILMLTHHQVLSVYDECFTKQAGQLFQILNRPVLWLWGHEHRLVIYETFEAPEKGWPAIIGRCIGHGGMPIDLPGKRKAGLLGKAEFVDKRLYANDENLRVGINGMVRMTIDGPRLALDYRDVYGQSVFEESFLAEDGVPERTGFTNHQLVPP